MKTAIKTLLYFFGLSDNPIKTECTNDAESILKDWRNVGNDIRRAMNIYSDAK